MLEGIKREAETHSSLYISPILLFKFLSIYLSLNPIYTIHTILTSLYIPYSLDMYQMKSQTTSSIYEDSGLSLIGSDLS